MTWSRSHWQGIERGGGRAVAVGEQRREDDLGDPSPSENLSLLPVTSRLLPLMFFNLHDTNECGRVCSRMARRSWWPHLLHV